MKTANRALKTALLTALVFICAACASCAAKNQESPVSGAVKAVNTAIGGKRVTIKGLARLTGNAPFYEIVISGDCEWHIPDDEKAKLTSLQQQIVAVRGTAGAEEMNFANRKFAAMRLYLKDIEVVAVNPPDTFKGDLVDCKR